MRNVFKHSRLIYFYLLCACIGFISLESCATDEPSAVTIPNEEVEEEAQEDTGLAQINFDTDGGVPIISKEDYVEGVLTVNGQDEFDDLIIDAKIRGRGNSTWGYPKKPYKIKLSSDASVLGMASEKDWVLLPNFHSYAI